MRAAFAALLLSLASPAVARDLLLSQPIDCSLGDTCYIQNYVDHDQSDAASDFACGSLTYDTHTGTDFALPSFAAMEDGVDVLAAAPGTVEDTRDGMPDQLFDPANADALEGRDCGNRVVVSHGGGWFTQYCHMKQGSVAVQTGDRVRIGTVLGQVGLSGRTEFPHVHFSVRRNGEVIDPFDPDGAIQCGALSEDTLWTTDLETPQGGILSLGFAEGVPSYEAIRAGEAAVETLRADAPIVLWALAFGSRPGDVMRLEISGPDGPMFEHDEALDATQALFFRAGGRRATDGGWPAGIYEGTATFLRDGTILGTSNLRIALP